MRASHHSQALLRVVLDVRKGMYAVAFAELHIKSLVAFGTTTRNVCPDLMPDRSGTPPCAEGVAAIVATHLGSSARCASTAAPVASRMMTCLWLASALARRE